MIPQVSRCCHCYRAFITSDCAPRLWPIRTPAAGCFDPVCALGESSPQQHPPSTPRKERCILSATIADTLTAPTTPSQLVLQDEILTFFDLGDCSRRREHSRQLVVRVSWQSRSVLSCLCTVFTIPLVLSSVPVQCAVYRLVCDGS